MFSPLILSTFVSPLIYGAFLTTRPPSLLRTVFKMLSVGCLAVLSATYGAPVLLTLALIFGTLGDGFLSRSGDRFFLAGLISFLLGHLAFAVLFWQLSPEPTIFPADPVRIGMAVALAGLAIGVSINLTPYLGELKVPVFIYVGVSLLMGFIALSLPQTWPVLLVTVGAILFIFSDVILAYDLFVIPENSDLLNYTSRILWAFYWGGQFLIFLGVTQAAAP